MNVQTDRGAFWLSWANRGTMDKKMAETSQYVWGAPSDIAQRPRRIHPTTDPATPTLSPIPATQRTRAQSVTSVGPSKSRETTVKTMLRQTPSIQDQDSDRSERQESEVPSDLATVAGPRRSTRARVYLTEDEGEEEKSGDAKRRRLDRKGKGKGRQITTVTPASPASTSTRTHPSQGRASKSPPPSET